MKSGIDVIRGTYWGDIMQYDQPYLLVALDKNGYTRYQAYCDEPLFVQFLMHETIRYCRPATWVLKAKCSLYFTIRKRALNEVNK